MEMQTVEEETAEKATTASRTLGWLGVLLTVGYLSLASSLLQDKDFGVLKPNEVGDFLAGIFAPLAFFWLVLGFFQQGIGLRQQAAELRSAAAHAADLVSVARDEHKANLEQIKRSLAESDRVQKILDRDAVIKAQPRFSFKLETGEGSEYQFSLTNDRTGGMSTQTSIEMPDVPDELNAFVLLGGKVVWDEFPPDASTLVFFRAKPGQVIHGWLNLNYCDAQGNTQQQKFQVYVGLAGLAEITRMPADRARKGW
jgi:hypothetical protein